MRFSKEFCGKRKKKKKKRRKEEGIQSVGFSRRVGFRTRRSIAGKRKGKTPSLPFNNRAFSPSFESALDGPSAEVDALLTSRFCLNDPRISRSRAASSGRSIDLARFSRTYLLASWKREIRKSFSSMLFSFFSPYPSLPEFGYPQLSTPCGSG